MDGFQDFFSRLDWHPSTAGGLAMVRDTPYLYWCSPETSAWAGAGGEPPPNLKWEFGRLKGLGFIGLRPPARAPELHTLVLNLAHDCNLACDYCNVAQGTYGGPRILMTPAVLRRALEFLLENSRSRELTVHFYGGEPLLNEGLLREAVLLLRSIGDRGFRLVLTTNGTLITPTIARFLAACGVQVIVSVDGGAGIHDLHRKTRDGRGSFSEVVRGIRMLAEEGAEFRLQATVVGGGDLNEVRAQLKRLVPEGVDIWVGREDREATAMPSDVTGASGTPHPGAKHPSILGNLLLGGHAPMQWCPSSYRAFVAPDGWVYPCYAWMMKGIQHRYGNVLDRDWRFNPPRPLAGVEGCSNGFLCGHGCAVLQAATGKPAAEACHSSRNEVYRDLPRLLDLTFEDVSRIFRSTSGPEGLVSLRQAWSVRQLLAGTMKHLRPVFLFPVPKDGEPGPRPVGDLLAAGLGSGEGRPGV